MKDMNIIEAGNLIASARWAEDLAKACHNKPIRIGGFDLAVTPECAAEIVDAITRMAAKMRAEAHALLTVPVEVVQ